MDSFRELYDRYYRDVYRFALFLTGDVARAEDLAADTFVRAWTARDRIRHETVRAYLLTIARNLYRDGLRSARQQVALDDRMVDRSPGIDVQVEHASTLRQVRARLRHVARGDRRALLLYVVRGMSYPEIAAALDVSVAAVKSRIFRARALIEEFLATDPEFARMTARFRRLLDERASSSDTRAPERQHFERRRKRAEMRQISLAFTIAYGLAALFPIALDILRGNSASRVTVVLASVFGTIAVGSAITWLIARTRTVGAQLH